MHGKTLKTCPYSMIDRVGERSGSLIPRRYRMPRRARVRPKKSSLPEIGSFTHVFKVFDRVFQGTQSRAYFSFLKPHICSSRCQVALFRQPQSASPGLAAPSASSRVPSASWEEASRLHLGCPIGPLTYPQLPPMRPAFQYSGAGLCRSPRESGSQVSRLAAGQSPGLRMGFSRVARRVAGRRVRRSGGYLGAATPPAPTALPAR
jgi:hypothetical protein